MPDVIKTSEEIDHKIKQLESGRKELNNRAIDKAEAMGIYRKEVAKTLIGLRNGKTYELDGESIQNPPASTSASIARGICWKEKIESNKSEGLYKIAIIGMQSLMAELNGKQSILRFIE